VEISRCKGDLSRGEGERPPTEYEGGRWEFEEGCRDLEHIGHITDGQLGREIAEGDPIRRDYELHVEWCRYNIGLNTASRNLYTNIDLG
jgi:hypothetical protein